MKTNICDLLPVDYDNNSPCCKTPAFNTGYGTVSIHIGPLEFDICAEHAKLPLAELVTRLVRDK
jgi:hypothetical protein